jgi:hypothetical protein
MRIADLRLLAVVCTSQLALGAAVRLARVASIRAATSRCRTLAQRAAGSNAERVVWAIEGVGRRLPRVSTCLTRALAAELLLTTDGAPGHIRIGIRRARSGALESHAWFERNGRILVGQVGADDYLHLVTWNTATASTASR